MVLDPQPYWALHCVHGEKDHREPEEDDAQLVTSTSVAEGPENSFIVASLRGRRCPRKYLKPSAENLSLIPAHRPSLPLKNTSLTGCCRGLVAPGLMRGGPTS